MNLRVFFIVFGFSLCMLILSIQTVSIQVGNGFATFIGDVFVQNTVLGQSNFLPSPAKPTSPSLQAFNSTTPIISRSSHEGIYDVQLFWSVPQTIQSPNILPQKGFDMHIEFLDRNASEQTNQTIGDHDLISDELRPVPIVKPLLPIESYDIAIYSEQGDILWNQENSNPTSGRSFERVTLDEPYNGNVTISITDIRSPLTSVVDSVQLPAVIK